MAAVNRDERTDFPYVDEIRTARFLGDLLPLAHSVVLTLSSTQRTWELMDAAAVGRYLAAAELLNSITPTGTAGSVSDGDTGE